MACPIDRCLETQAHHQSPSNASRLSRGTYQCVPGVIFQDETSLFPFPFPEVRLRPWRICAVKQCALFFKAKCPSFTIWNEMAHGPFHSICVSASLLSPSDMESVPGLKGDQEHHQEHVDAQRPEENECSSTQRASPKALFRC